MDKEIIEVDKENVDYSQNNELLERLDRFLEDEKQQQDQ